MVEQEDAELTSPQKTSKIHLHLAQFSMRTNRRLAKTHTIKAVRKLHMESERKGKEAIRSGPVPRRRFRKGVRLHKQGFWGENGSRHILGISVLVSNRGNISPLGGWSASGISRKAVGRLVSNFEEDIHTCLLSLYIYFFFFFFLRAAGAAYGNSQVRG